MDYPALLYVSADPGYMQIPEEYVNLEVIIPDRLWGTGGRGHSSAKRNLGVFCSKEGIPWHPRHSVYEYFPKML